MCLNLGDGQNDVQTVKGEPTHAVEIGGHQIHQVDRERELEKSGVLSPVTSAKMNIRLSFRKWRNDGNAR